MSRRQESPVGGRCRPSIRSGVEENRTLLVLGAGVYQVPGIRAAVARGLTVITADWDLKNPGHHYSHAQVEVSTVDHNGVLDVARAEKVDGIVTFASDVATPAVAHVSSALGLHGPAPEAVDVLSNKGRTRALQHAHGLRAPAYAVGRSSEELIAAVARMRGAIMVKPVDSSGSRGVIRVELDRPTAFRTAFRESVSFSRSKQVCVEEFLLGEEVGGDGVMVGGRLAFVQCTRKHRRGYIVTGHSLPPSIPEEQQRRVADAVEAVCKAAGYLEGVVNFDVIVDGESATVVELSPRTGGNGIPALLGAVTGVDTVQACIGFALGEPPTLPSRSAAGRASAGTAVLGAKRTGTVAHRRTEEEVRALLPELIEYVCNIPVSGEVPAWDNAGASLGYCLFRCPDGVSYDMMAARARAASGIEETLE